MHNRLLFLSLLITTIMAVGCSDPEGSASKATSDLSIEVSNPNSLRDLSLIYQIGDGPIDTLANISEGNVTIPVPAFSESLVIRYSIVSMDYVLVTKELTLNSDMTVEEKSVTVQVSVIAAMKEIQKDKDLDSVPLSLLYEELFNTLEDSGSLSVVVRYPDSTENDTTSLFDEDLKFFDVDTVKVVLLIMITKNQIDSTTQAILPPDWVTPSEDTAISNELLFSITSETMLNLLPGEYSVAQVDSMKMARLEDSVFSEKMVEVSPGLLAGRWEVTQKQYYDLMGYAIPSEEDEDKPIVSVSVYDAILYCNALSKKNGYDTVYTYTDVTFMGTRAKAISDLEVLQDVDGYRLPTITEWNIAYTSGSLSNGDYYWGDATDPAIVEKFANVSFSATGLLEPIGMRRPTPAGLFDMNGNAAERTIDSDDGGLHYFLGGSYASEGVDEFMEQSLDGARPDNWLGFRLFRYSL